MAIELYIKDKLSADDRWAIEAKRMFRLNKLNPDGIGIGPNLEKKIMIADGLSSKFEMLEKFDDMGIAYFQNFPNLTYSFKILIPEDKIDVIKELAEKSGYVPVYPKDYQST